MDVRVGITIGDANGIGPELILRTFLDARMMDGITPVVYGSSKVFSAFRKELGMKDAQFFKVSDAADVKQKKVNLIDILPQDLTLDIGKPTKEGGRYALASLEAATADLAANKIDVLVTAPINKDNIQSTDFDFPGHTEYLAKLSNVEEALMFMCSEGLRVGVVTGHIPLKNVPSTITTAGIYNKIEQINTSLTRDFAITKPRIAVLGLNPHAGEKGLLGEEDGAIISPAIRKAFDNGILAFGPYPADGFFGSSGFKKFDAVLAMYHDQGLIPFKAMTFGQGVNYTAGLPIVRTSPDHGTAYDLAGKGEASISSFRTAVYLARDIYLNRQMHKEITANPLQPQNVKGGDK